MTMPQPRSTDRVLLDTLALLPDGFASSHDPSDFLGARFRPLAAELASIEASALSQLPEVDPRAALHLLPDYERVLGPDECGRDQLALTDADRRLLAWQRWTRGGNMCAGYFVAAGAAIGVALTIEEFPLSQCGELECGTEPVPFPQHLAFLVSLPASRSWDAECGELECGEAAGGFTPNLMECVIRAEAPLWTQPVFNYTS